MLAADAVALADAIRTAGGDCELQVWPDQVHVFQALPRLTPEAAPAMRRIAASSRTRCAPTPSTRQRGNEHGPVRISNKRSRDAAAVITGAGSGIGAAFAVELANRGGRVVCSDIDENAAQRNGRRDQRRRRQGDWHCAATSRRSTTCSCLADEAQAWFGGPPTLVINNAGVGAGGLPIGEVSLDDWNWVLDINLWGPIHGCHVFAPILREAGYRRASSTSPRPRRSARHRAWPPTTSARPACCRCRRRWPPKCPAPASTSRCCARRSSRPISSTPAGSSDKSTQLADRLMRWTGFSPERVARTCLDTHDRGGLYCMPQPDARIGWGIKRFTPTVYTRAVGLTTRVTTP